MTIRTILRNATRGQSKLNILTCPTHEAYETNLCKTEHNFYAIRHESVKDWDWSYRPVPKNYVLLNPKRQEHQLPPEVSFDLVLSQNKFGQFQILSQYADKLSIPLISLEHTLPVPSWSEDTILNLQKARGKLNVFISEFSKERWGFDDSSCRVIHHGIDTDLFSPSNTVDKDGSVLSVVNDWINRDWCCGFNIWKRVTSDIKTKVIGNTPGLSFPAKSVQELVLRYRQAPIFLNTSTISPVPTALLEAMSCGVACVSTATAMIPEVIENGYNGFISNDENELKDYIIKLINNDELRNKIGDNARKTILEKFSIKSFVDSWNNIFKEVLD